MKKRTSMKTKQLGNSDLFITPVGFGSWAIGGSGWQFAWGKQNDDDPWLPRDFANSAHGGSAERRAVDSRPRG